MRLTKYTHSCVRIDDASASLVIDPGIFSELDIALLGANAVLITHEHADHLDADSLRAVARANTELRIWAPAPVAAQLVDLGDQVTVAGPNETFEAAGFRIRTFGGVHAVIHPSMCAIANTGYLINDVVYHPGDSFAVPAGVPSVAIETLLLPIHAPWSKIADVIDFMIAMRAPRAFQIHDGLLNDRGLGIVEAQLTRFGAQYGTEYRHLSATESLTV